MQESNSTEHKLVRAYHHMTERVKSLLEDAEKTTLPSLHNAIETAKSKATELEELTREEAEKIGDYLRRDLHDAGRFLAETGEDLGSWLKFDIEQVEDKLWQLFSSAADQTKLELMKLDQVAHQPLPYQTGEVTGPGTLACTQCKQQIHFAKAGHIPPCPKCHATKFERVEFSDAS